jgi:SAM-dependent methyltransferase
MTSRAQPDTDPLTPALIDALTTDRDAGFCRFLRRLYLEELQAGHVTVPPPDAALLERARDLGLLRAASRGLRLTDIGYEAANVAKEFVNWLDAGRQLPEGVPASILAGRRVLDVGCSFGRQTIGFALRGANTWGIDFQSTYLRLSSAFARQQGVPPLKVARARAEQLPFLANSFDVVFCRLVINYVTSIDGTLEEFNRVLRPGGVLVLIIEPLGAPLRALWTSKWIGNARTIGFILFGLLNTAIVECGGRQLVLRRQGRMHAQHSPAWPTGRWLSRRLGTHGFTALSGDTLRDPHRPVLFLGVLPQTAAK